MHVASTVRSSFHGIAESQLTGPASDLLLHVEPSNMQAQSLKSLIDQAETREGYIGEHLSSAGISKL